MLEWIDRAAAAMSWTLAGIVIVMLLFGPALVAHDRAASGASSASPYATPTADGKQLFISNCGSCHTLSSAGTSGQVGPDLDGVPLTSSQVADQVRNGGGAMPAFAGRLSDAQIQAVAKFVAGNR